MGNSNTTTERILDKPEASSLFRKIGNSYFNIQEEIR